MGDRICIRIANGIDKPITFYGHSCGLRGLKTMVEVIDGEHGGPGNIMCNFIRQMMPEKQTMYDYDLWVSSENDDKAADCQWGLWTYHPEVQVWTTTYPRFREKQLKRDEVLGFIEAMYPCMFRTCPCDHYNMVCAAFPKREDMTDCHTAYLDRMNGVDVEAKMKELGIEERPLW